MPPFNTANAIDYSLIALYFAVVVWVGLYSARKNRGTADYFRGGGKIPWVLAGLSNWVAGFSAFMFVAAAGFTYNYGLVAILVYTSACWSYLIGFFSFAKLWRRARIESPLEFLTRRYSPSTTYFWSVTSIIPQVVGIGQGLYIVCLVVSSMLGFANRQIPVFGTTLAGYQLSVIIVGTVMVFYTAIGGLWAAILSDAVQCIILAVMSLIVFGLSFRYLGQGAGFFAGFHQLALRAPADYFHLHGETAAPLYFVAVLIAGFLGYNCNWSMVQRYHSVADERGAQKMAMLCAALSVVAPLLWILPVMTARVLFPNMHLLWPGMTAPEEESFVSLALLLLPHGMLGFVVSAILSAALGSANDIFNWLSATVTHDLYVPLRRWRVGTPPTDQQQMRVAHGSMVVLGMLGVAVALYIPRFGGAFVFASYYYSLTNAFYIPVALGMLYQRTPWWSGIASCSSAIVVTLALMYCNVWGGNWVHSYVRNVLVETAVASLVFALSSLWYRADDPRSAGARQLESNLKIPVIAEQVRSDGGTLRIYGLIGAVSGLLGIVLIACSFLPAGGNASSSKTNVAAGIMLLMLGGTLRFVSRRHQTVT